MVLAFSLAFVKVRVPEVVTGDPETENSAGAASATLVTVPEPETVCQLAFVPLVCKNIPALPPCDGSRLLIAPDWVVAPVPPLAIPTVPVTFDAVPVVFWLSVGTSAAWIAEPAHTEPLLRK